MPYVTRSTGKADERNAMKAATPAMTTNQERLTQGVCSTLREAQPHRTDRTDRTEVFDFSPVWLFLPGT
jgi:hypothetical protein